MINTKKNLYTGGSLQSSDRISGTISEYFYQYIFLSNLFYLSVYLTGTVYIIKLQASSKGRFTKSSYHSDQP